MHILADWRARMDLSQRAAAAALGISLTTWQQLESGTSRQTGEPVEPDRRTLLACAALEAGLAPIGAEGNNPQKP